MLFALWVHERRCSPDRWNVFGKSGLVRNGGISGMKIRGGTMGPVLPMTLQSRGRRAPPALFHQAPSGTLIRQRVESPIPFRGADFLTTWPHYKSYSYTSLPDTMIALPSMSPLTSSRSWTGSPSPAVLLGSLHWLYRSAVQ